MTKHSEKFEIAPVVFISVKKYPELKGMFPYEESDTLVASGDWMEDFLMEITEDDITLTADTIILLEFLSSGGCDYTFVIEE